MGQRDRQRYHLLRMVMDQRIAVYCRHAKRRKETKGALLKIASAVLEFLDYILKDSRLWDIPNPQGKSYLSQRGHIQVLI